MKMSNDCKRKTIGIKSNEDVDKRLNKHTFEYNISKKDWLESNLQHDESQAKLEIEIGEKWVKIPSSAYNTLLVNPESHASFIADRIEQHTINSKMEINFDTLFNEVKIFQKLNDIECIMVDEGKNQVIFCKHDMGNNCSRFFCNLILEIIKRTTKYTVVSNIVTERTFNIVVCKSLN